MRIETKQDLPPLLNGYMNWEFDGKANFDGFVDYFWKNFSNDEIDEFDHEGPENLGYKTNRFGEYTENMMINYLKSVGEDPEVYSLPNK